MSTGHQSFDRLTPGDSGDKSLPKTEHNAGNFAAQHWRPEGAADRSSSAAAEHSRTEASRTQLASAGVLPSVQLIMSDASAAKPGSPASDTTLRAAEGSAYVAGHKGAEKPAAMQFAESGTVRNDVGRADILHPIWSAVPGPPRQKDLKKFYPHGRPVPYDATLHDYDKSVAGAAAGVRARVEADCARTGHSEFKGYSQGAHGTDWGLHQAAMDATKDKKLSQCEVSADLWGPPHREGGFLRDAGKSDPRLKPQEFRGKLPEKWHVRYHGHDSDPFVHAPRDLIDGVGRLLDGAHDYTQEFADDAKRSKK